MNEQSLDEARVLISGFLKQRRVDLGLSQEAIAERCGVARKTINELESGRFWPNMRQFLLVCEALKLCPSVVEISGDILKALRKNLR